MDVEDVTITVPILGKVLAFPHDSLVREVVKCIRRGYNLQGGCIAVRKPDGSDTIQLPKSVLNKIQGPLFFIDAEVAVVGSCPAPESDDSSLSSEMSDGTVSSFRSGERTHSDDSNQSKFSIRSGRSAHSSRSSRSGRNGRSSRVRRIRLGDDGFYLTCDTRSSAQEATERIQRVLNMTGVIMSGDDCLAPADIIGDARCKLYFRLPTVLEEGGRDSSGKDESFGRTSERSCVSRDESIRTPTTESNRSVPHQLQEAMNRGGPQQPEDPTVRSNTRETTNAASTRAADTRYESLRLAIRSPPCGVFDIICDKMEIAFPGFAVNLKGSIKRPDFHHICVEMLGDILASDVERFLELIRESELEPMDVAINAEIVSKYNKFVVQRPWWFWYLFCYFFVRTNFDPRKEKKDKRIRQRDALGF